MPESNFVDYVKIHCRSGKGGRGSAHLHRAKYQPKGGPDGGDGGRGGNVYLRGNRNYWTLLHLRYERHVFAGDGGAGSKARSHGYDGDDKYIDVPCGTVAYDAETGRYLCDVTDDGQVVLLLKGGRGGLGNWQFRTATRQTPRFAQPGEPGEEREIVLELKTIADVGLVGYPNAGKSTHFNRLIGKRRAITDPTPGVTRAPIPERWLLGNTPVTLVDSGGVKLDKEGIDYAVTDKSLSLLDQSDAIIFLMDCTEVTAEDLMLVEALRPYTDKVLLTVNKVDDPRREDLVWNFFSYGYQRVVGISAAHGTGIEELED